jgi:hypothetical protein
MSVPERYAQTVLDLNASTREARLTAARELAAAVASGAIPPVTPSGEVNNHVHTAYSFSPYSPTSAAWHAQRAGLQAVGIMDHDSVAGVEEMHRAGAILGIATTAGFEIRVNFHGTPFADRLINGPGLTGIAYIAVHGIPAGAVDQCRDFLRPVQAARNARNAAMMERLNNLLRRQGVPEIDFQLDVFHASMAAEGGAITERHILAAHSNALIAAHGKGAGLVRFLEERLALTIPAKVRGYLLDPANPHYLYDLLGLLKAFYTDAFFIHPDATECIPVADVLAFADAIGGISAYAYLGDVTESPTGDKKAEQFEDAFLDELMDWLGRLGFRAVTYMPPRNTAAQLDRIARLCEQHGFMQISGVDINSSRQSFNCPEILDPRFANLITATWALIGHEKLSTAVPGAGLFGEAATTRHPALADRLEAYAALGRRLDPHAPTRLDAVAPLVVEATGTTV